MARRSRLRSTGSGKKRLVVMMVLTGCALFMGLHFFSTTDSTVLDQLLTDDNTDDESLLDSRGTIYDRNFRELAITLEKVSVYADVRDVDADETAEALSNVLDVEAEQLKEIIEKEHFRAWLAKNISQEQEEEVGALGLQGVYLNRERVRYYPEQQSAAHLVGFVGKSMGLAGVEYRYNALLNRYGASLLKSGAQLVEEEVPASNGEGYVVLSLDMKIQKILEKLTAELGSKREGARIGALLMECRTGKVLAGSGYPTFDPNNFRNYGWEETHNVLAAPVAVPERIRQLLWDASLIQSHFETDGNVVPWSVISATRSLGSQLRLWDHLGLNDPLKVDFVKGETGDPENGERALVGVEPNDFDSVPQVATPLHIATAVNGLLMGGQLPHPQLIDRIAGGDGKVLRLPPVAGKQTVSAAAAEEIGNMVAAQMEKGPLASGYLEIDSLAYGGTKETRKYARNKFYISAIPQDKPELMLFVFAHLPPFSPIPAETKSRFSIAESAQPATVSMVAMEKVMSTLSDMMTAEEKDEMNFQLQRHVANGVTIASIDSSEYLGTMPDLKGFSLRKSLRYLNNLHMEIQVTGTGVVVDQTPVAGEQVKKGDLCRLVLKPH